MSNNNNNFEPSAKTLVEVAKQIKAISAESPEKGNAVMDLMEDYSYEELMSLAR